MVSEIFERRGKDFEAGTQPALRQPLLPRDLDVAELLLDDIAGIEDLDVPYLAVGAENGFEVGVDPRPVNRQVELFVPLQDLIPPGLVEVDPVAGDECLGGIVVALGLDALKLV